VLGSIAAPVGAFSNEKVSVCGGTSGSVALASKVYSTISGIVASLGTSVSTGASLTAVTVSVTVAVVSFAGAGVWPWSFTVIVSLASPTKFSVGVNVEATTAAFNASSVLVNTIWLSSVPSPVVNVSPATEPSVTVPLTTVSVVCTSPLPASTSETPTAPAWIVPVVSSSSVHASGSGYTKISGASLTAVTVMSTWTMFESAVPSFALYVKLSGPL